MRPCSPLQLCVPVLQQLSLLLLLLQLLSQGRALLLRLPSKPLLLLKLALHLCQPRLQVSALSLIVGS